jgi:FixJ family two-component response regulator
LPGAHQHYICIVDDDAGVRDSMRILLDSHGFQISDFASAAAFLAAPLDYCCLIVDHRMPAIDGLELLEMLRASGIATPAILMTDKDEPTLSRRIHGLRDCACLTKPITEANLVRNVGTACERCTN